VKTTSAQRSAFQRNRARTVRREILCALHASPGSEMGDGEIHGLLAFQALHIPREALHEHLDGLAEIGAVTLRKHTVGEIAPSATPEFATRRIWIVKLTEMGVEFVRGTRTHTTIARPRL